MDIKIKIDEEKITQIVEKMIAEQIFEARKPVGREARYGIASGVDKAVKQYIYSKKDEIIEKCIDRATKEIVRKGLPKLLEREF